MNTKIQKTLTPHNPTPHFYTKHPLSFPICHTRHELAKDVMRILGGEEPTTTSVNEVKELPDNFKNWMQRNQERIDKRIKEGKPLPYFVRDNTRLVDGKLKNGVGRDPKSNDSKFVMSKEDAHAIYNLPQNQSATALSDEQLENNAEIASILNLKQTSFAPRGHFDVPNINTSNDEQNCVACVLAYMSQRNGLNTKARPFMVNYQDKDDKIAKIMLNEFGMWTNGTKEAIYTPKIFTVTNKEHIIQRFNETGIYQLSWDWKSEGGHTLIVEKLPSGHVMVFDPQTNTFKNDDYIGYICNKGISFKSLRIDNKQVRTENIKLMLGRLKEVK